MFGIDSVISVINPPQSTILGVGQTSKQIIFDGTSSNPDKPYRVASMCQLIVSADHRVVDGALASQWLKRIQKYL